jgi:hypothetical protein
MYQSRSSLLATLGFATLLSVGAAGLLWHPATAQSNEPAEEESDVVVEPTTNNPRFSCQFMNNAPTVAYSPVEQPNQQYAWATPRDLGGGWSAERRCAEISRRLEEYRPDGLLELRTGLENDYDIICVTTEDNPACRIVLTVPPGQDPIATRDAVFDNLTLADSGQATQGVPTLQAGRDGNILDEISDIFGIDLPGGGTRQEPSARRSAGINLRPFLAPSDRGTGEHLNLSGRTLPSIPRNTTPTTQPRNPSDSDLQF